MKKIAVLLLVSCLSRSLAEEPLKIAVMDLKARSGIDKMVLLSLTDLVCTEIAGFGGMEVIARDDMQAMLEHIADKQLLECDDTKCLAQVGGALGVAQLLSGNIGKVGEVYLINLKLIDIEEAKVLNRFSKEFKGDEAGLITYVKHAVNVLFGRPGLDPEALAQLEKQAANGPPLLQQEQMMMTEAPKPKPSLAKNLLRYGMIAVGVGSAALSAYMYMEGNKIYNDKYKNEAIPPGMAKEQFVQEIAGYREQVQDYDLKTNILMGASGVFLLGGVITFVF